MEKGAAKTAPISLMDMHANPKHFEHQRTVGRKVLQPASSRNTLGPRMFQFLRLLRLAFWRAFQHDAFAVAKASAYSSILTFFPALLVVGSVLATSRSTQPYLQEISYAISRMLPAGAGTALAYLRGASQHSVS